MFQCLARLQCHSFLTLCVCVCVCVCVCDVVVVHIVKVPYEPTTNQHVHCGHGHGPPLREVHTVQREPPLIHVILDSRCVARKQTLGLIETVYFLLLSVLANGGIAITLHTEPQTARPQR